MIICLEEKEIKKHWRSAPPTFVINQKKHMIRSLSSIDWINQRKMGARYRDLVHGKDLVDLKARIKAGLSKTPSKTVKKWQERIDALSLSNEFVDEFGGAKQSPRFDATKSFFKSKPILRQMAALRMLESKIEDQTDLQTTLASLLSNANYSAVGTRVPEFVNTYCLAYEEVIDGKLPPYRGIGCGMGSLTPSGGRYLRFLALEKKQTKTKK